MGDRLLKESDVLKIAFQLPLVVNSAFADAVKALPTADIPQGEVDAVEIYEKAESQLERNEITVGEFEKIIEPLKHLSYGTPQGKGMTNSEWKEFLAEQWGVSKACAKEMLHAMYAIKKKDSIKKGFDKRKGADDE